MASAGTGGSQRSKCKHRSVYKPIQILKPNYKGYSIVEEEIKRVFGHPDVADTPVAIYSVGGAFRKGKSFILNFFLRYLWAQKRDKPEEWLASKEDELVAGFGWRGGTKSHTEGIWIWDEPFFMETNHEKVAVFIMDTQGSFDQSTPFKDSSVIFGLSTLISSVQIYNVQDQIQDDTLQHLQVFFEYAKAAKEESCQGKPLQNLLFLIRDWSDPDYEYGFVGGDQVLLETLRIRLRHSDAVSVRESLLESFENISCCLLPHPGKQVAVRSSKQGSHLYLKDIDDEFLDEVGKFVQEFLSPSKIVVKTINNRKMKGKELINCLLAYFRVFESGKMPEVEGMLQACAKAAVLTLLEDCKNLYGKYMNQKLGSSFLSCEHLHDLHASSKAEALRLFNQTHKLGGDLFISQYQTYLDEFIEQQYGFIRKRNEHLEEAAKAQIRRAVDKARVKYGDILHKKSGGQYVEDEKIKEIEKQCRETAIHWYEKETQTQPQELVERCHQKLSKMLDEELDAFKRGNDKLFEAMLNSLRKESCSALYRYKQCMKERNGDKDILNDEMLSEAQNYAELETLKDFDSGSVGKDTCYKRKERRSLQLKIRHLHASWKKTNDQKKILKGKEILAKVINAYQAAMSKVKVDGGYTEEHLLNEAHAKAQNHAKATVALHGLEQNQGDKYVLQITEMTEHEFEKILEENNRKKETLVVAFKDIMFEVYENYETEMAEKTKEYTEEKSLHQQHDGQKSMAINNYKSRTKNCEGEVFVSITQQLEEKIDAHFSRLQQRNQRKKKRIQQHGKLIVEAGICAYMLNMSMTCNGSSIPPYMLEIIHQKLRNDVEVFYKQLGSVSMELAKACVEEYQNQVDTLFKKIRNQNKKNVDRFLLKTGALYVTACASAGAQAGLSLALLEAVATGASLGSVASLPGMLGGAVFGGVVGLSAILLGARKK